MTPLLLSLSLLIAVFAHFGALLSPKGEKETKNAEKVISPQQKSQLHSLRSKNVLAVVDRWLFDEPMEGDVGTIVTIMNHLVGKIEKGIALESEDERKVVNGIGQMLRMAQRKTIGQMAADRKVNEHAILEQLFEKVEKLRNQNVFMAKTFAIWVEGMPFLVDRLFDRKIQAKDCDNLVNAIETFCECLISRQLTGIMSWQAFCGELKRLEKKEQAKMDQKYELCQGTEEQMWGMFPSPRGQGSGAMMSPGNVPKLELPTNFPTILSVPTLNLNVSKLSKKRQTETDEKVAVKMEQQVEDHPVARLNVPTLDLNAARLSMKRLTEENAGNSTRKEAKKKTEESHYKS